MMNSSLLFDTHNLTIVSGDDDMDINRKYHLHIIVPILWSLIIIFGILGNGLIIYIILKRRLYKNSCTHCYIINVAIADLCFTLICVPITMSAYIYDEWIFGKFMCKFENLLMFSSVQAACLTLTAMTIDRYMAILYPLKSIDFRTTKMAFLTNIFIWIASFILNIPYFFYYIEVSYPEYPVNTHAPSENQTVRLLHYCISEFPDSKILSEKSMTIYTVLISYVLPLLIITFCYMRMILQIVRKSRGDSLTEQYRSTFSDRNQPSSSSVKKISHNPLTNNNHELVHLRKKRKTRSSANSESNLEPSVPSTPKSMKKAKSVRNNLKKKQRAKLLFLIATVAITFATTWLPAHVIQIWKVVFTESFPFTDTMYLFKVVSHTLTYSNSLFNPIIYVFIGAKFRSYIKLEVSKLLCLKPDTSHRFSHSHGHSVTKKTTHFLPVSSRFHVDD